MATTKIYGNASAFISHKRPDAVLGTGASYDYDVNNESRKLLQSFGPIPESLLYKEITALSVYAYCHSWKFSTSFGGTADVSVLYEPFTPEAVTYNTRPSAGRSFGANVFRDDVPAYQALLSYSGLLFGDEILSNGVMLDTYEFQIYTNQGSQKPYVLVTHGDTNVGLTVSASAPRVNEKIRKEATTVFQWYSYASSDDTLAAVEPSKATFRWRNKGSTSIHEVSLDARSSYSAPAGTFDVGTIEWQVEVLSNSGVTTTTEWRENTVVSPEISGASPASGFVPKFQDALFSWAISHSGFTDTVAQKSANFKWRVTGSSTINKISVGADTFVTVPANTFTADSIQWQVEATTVGGSVAISEWYTISTLEQASTAKPLRPVNTVIGSSVDNTFYWEHIIPTGSAQTAFDLQTSPDGAVWSNLQTGSTQNTFATVPANTLPGGDLYWRVRTYNTDSTAGEWSEAAHCIVIAAPNAPSVSVTRNAPKFSIRWQQTGQQAYEIRVDGTVVQKKFGVDTAYEHISHLDDGTHIIEVRIQNKYSLWSDWSSVSIVVTNKSGGAIKANATGGNPIVLSWNAYVAYSSYSVYRDGTKIGESDTGLFTDHFAVGVVEYQVRGVLSDGNYTMSNPVEVDASVSRMMIAAVDSPEWLDISLSASSLRRTTYNAAQAVTFKNYIGNALPSAEIGEHVSKTYNFDVAWPTKDRASIEAFERLLGKLVCVKTPYDGRFIGILNPIDRRENRFVTTFNASVTLVDWKEMGK